MRKFRKKLKNKIVTENQLMSESVPAGKVQNNDIGDMQKVKGKGEMYFKQNPGGKDKGISPSMKSKQMKSSSDSPIVKKS